MNSTDTSQMTHQNPLHHQPPLMESDKTNKMGQSSSSSPSPTSEQSQDQTSLLLEASDSDKEQIVEPITRLPSEASDPDKKVSFSSTENEQQQQEEDRESEKNGGENGRERLKRHRREVAGRVWIPEIWGQEELLKDWIDCSTFDSCLVPSGISSARSALVEEARRASSNGGLRLDTRCLISR